MIPSGGGIGGGIALPSGITQPAFVQFQKYPVLQEVGPGTSLIVDLSLKNPASSSQKIGISLIGIPSNWINLFENNISLGPYQTRTISFTVVVPENAEAGDYLVKADIHDTTIKGYSYFIIRVKEYPSNYSAPQIYRRVNLNFVDNTSSVDITVVNDAAMHRKVNVYEKIPKAIADNVDQVDFQTAPTEIVQADPIVMFSLENIAPRERREIKYNVNNVISEYEPYVYWPIDRIDVLYEKGLEKVQVSNVYQTILNPGEDNYLLLDVGNIYSAPVDVVIQTWLPKGWNSTPASIELNIPPMSQTNIRFKINVPFDANMGVYYGTLQLQYENSIISKELVFRVQEISLFGGIIGFFMSLINSGFLLALVIAFLIIMGVRIARREMNRGYEYKGDVGRTLGEIKGILKRR